VADIIFYIIALSTCLFAFLTVASRDVFHSAVWLSLTLLSVAAIYFYLDAQFLGVIQVLVYIGGIITLFIFAIKLTAKIGDKTIQQANEQALLSGLAAFVFFIILFKMIALHPWAELQPQAPVFSLEDIGKSMLTTYVLPFEFLSLLLLAAMVGAIVIGKVRK